MFSSASLSVLSLCCYCSFLQECLCSEMQYQMLLAILVTLRSKASWSSPPLCMACSVVFVFALFLDCSGAASSQPYSPAFILSGLCEREPEAGGQGCASKCRRSNTARHEGWACVMPTVPAARPALPARRAAEDNPQCSALPVRLFVSAKGRLRATGQQRWSWRNHS